MFGFERIIVAIESRSSKHGVPLPIQLGKAYLVRNSFCLLRIGAFNLTFCVNHTRIPGLRKFREESGLDFRPHAEFKKADLDARQELYRQIAERIWNPEILMREANA